MKTIVFSSHRFERLPFDSANNGSHLLDFIEPNLQLETTPLAQEYECACIFVNDTADRAVLERLSSYGLRFLALRSAGYNHVDLEAAKELGIKVANVPEYSPHAVAEHTVGLMLALNRKLVRAYNRVRDLNFSLEGLVGFDLHGKTVGLIGVGRIGSAVAKIMHGFGCRIVAYDIHPDNELTESCGVEYVDLNVLCKESDIVSLHTPVTEETKYIIAHDRIQLMKDGVMLINTSRGALVHTKDVVAALKSGKIGYLGIDVYEEESGLFFEDHSEDIVLDDTIARLMTFPNVIITSHQAFLTKTALKNIAEQTIQNLDFWEKGEAGPRELS